MSDSIESLIAELIAGGSPPGVAASVVARAFALGVVDRPAGIRMPSAGAERTRRWREKRRLGVTSVTDGDVFGDASRFVLRDRHQTSQVTPSPSKNPTKSAKSAASQVTLGDADAVPSFTDFPLNSEVKKEKKVTAPSPSPSPSPSRGTRMVAGTPLSDTDRQFALDAGVTDADAVWAEFVDYWIAVPGSRGLKSNWPATWRNRVREVIGRRRGRLASPPAKSHMNYIRERLDNADRLDRENGAAPAGLGGRFGRAADC